MSGITPSAEILFMPSALQRARRTFGPHKCAMRLRVLLTDGKNTTDLIWFKHTGRDIYGGFVGAKSKYSYHASGKLHQKSTDGGMIKLKEHLPLSAFRGRFEICAFGIQPKAQVSRVGREFSMEKADAILYLDARVLPENVMVAVGLLEPGKLDELNGIAMTDVVEVRQLFLVTNTNPWIYLAVRMLKPDWEQKAREILEKKLGIQQ